MNRPEIHIDLVRDWERTIFRWFVSHCGQGWSFTEPRNKSLSDVVRRGDFSALSQAERRALVSYYYNLCYRIVPPGKRKLLFPDEAELFANVASDKVQNLKLGWKEFKKEVETGCSLEERQTEKRFEIDGKDVFLNRFRIQHFHLEVKSSKRDDYVAYCFVNDAFVKVIAIETHRVFGKAKVCQLIVEKAYALYPEEFAPFKIGDGGNVTELSLDEQKKLAWMNVNACFQIGDTKFYPIGMGSMMDGSSMESQRWMARDLRLLLVANREMRKHAEENLETLACLLPGSATSVEFGLTDFDGQTVEVRTLDEIFRMTFNGLSGEIVLSVAGTALKRKVLTA